MSKEAIAYARKAGADYCHELKEDSGHQFPELRLFRPEDDVPDCGVDWPCETAQSFMFKPHTL